MSTVRALLLLPLLATVATAQLHTLTPDQMEHDLFQLSEEFETNHGGLLRYASREELDEAFGDLAFAAAEEMNELEFYRRVSRLVSTLRCGHTNTQPSPRMRNAALALRGCLPLEVFLDDDRLFVVRSLDDSLAPGAEILAIDGHAVAEIRRTVFAQMSGDGSIETGKERNLEQLFSMHYALAVQQRGDQGPFAISLAGETETALVEGIPSTDYMRLKTARPGRPVIELELRKEDDLGILRVSTFGNPQGGSFPDDLKAAFARVREAGVEHLVLDLRGNGGGDDTYGALLVSYFSPEDFGYFERIEVTALYEGEGGIVEEGGLRLVTAHPGLQVQHPSEPGFRGEAFVLIDGWTFSTAADVATVMHHNGLATFVGEETGGGYDGNTSGITERFGLRHSGISFTCPRWMYITANVGHAHPGRGVPPDHSPARTIADVLVGRDVELDWVLARIAGE